MDIWREPVRGGYPDPRTFGWSGLETLQNAIKMGGPRAPMSYLTGLLLTEAERDHVVFEMPASEWWLSSQEHVSVGALTMLADAALACAVMVGLPPATPYTTWELSMTFLEPCGSGGVLRAIGTPLHDGYPLGASQCWVEDGRGVRVAHGTSTCYVLPHLEGFPPPSLDDFPPYVEPEYDTPDPWARPASGAIIPWDEWRGLSGEQILNKQIAGELPHPPVHYLTGMTLREAGDSCVTFTMPAGEWLTSPARTVEGGAVAMLAHAALTTAVVSTLQAGEAYRPVDVKVNFLRPVYPTGEELVARGTVTHRGKNLAVATGNVFSAEGKKLATATGSTIILPERAEPDR